MFNNPVPADSSFEEGTVTEVDVIHTLCKVKTLSGQNLNAVTWPQPSGGSSRGGDRVTPLLGDRVKISTALGYPVIIAFLPRLQNDENIFPINIDSGQEVVNTGSFSPAGDSIIADQNAAKDMLVGDRVIASQGGGLVGILRGGSILLRSSRLAEVFLSKWDDLVRIVSRNFEHYTDLSSTIVKNLEGRIYSYFGAAQTFGDSKVEAYQYHQYVGDVALALAAKTNYSLLEAFPETDARVYKEQVTEGSGGTLKELLRRELSIDGTHDLVVVDSTAELFTRIKNTHDEVIVTYADVNVIKINKDQINLTKGGDPTINMDDTGITSTFKETTVKQDAAGIHCTYKGAEIHLIEDGAHITFSGGEVKLIGDGIHLTYGGGEHKLTSSEVSSTFGGHFVKVTSGGVALG